jgi:hypothetical protein
MFKSKKQHITELYQNVLLRDPDPAGLDAYEKSSYSIDEIKENLLRCDERKQLLLKQNILIKMPRDILPKNTTVDFWDTDSEWFFNRNKPILGKDWIWHDRPVTYKVNSLGYRMNEFDQIDWSNYIAVFGCSFTAGVGLPLEETWSHRISKSLNCDLVNAGIPGGGNSCMLMNFYRLLASKKPPKVAIFSWSILTRKCFPYNNDALLYGCAHQSNDILRSEYNNYIKNDIQWAHQFMEIKRQVDTLCKLANIPVWHFSNFPMYDFVDSVDKIYPHYDYTSIDGINKTLARDFNFNSDMSQPLSHPGIDLQNKIVNRWDEIKSNLGF